MKELRQRELITNQKLLRKNNKQEIAKSRDRLRPEDRWRMK